MPNLITTQEITLALYPRLAPAVNVVLHNLKTSERRTVTTALLFKTQEDINLRFEPRPRRTANELVYCYRPI